MLLFSLLATKCACNFPKFCFWIFWLGKILQVGALFNTKLFKWFQIIQWISSCLKKTLKSNKVSPMLFNQLIKNIFISAILYVGPTLGLLCKASILHWSDDFETMNRKCAGTSWSREDMAMSSRRIYFTGKPHSWVSFLCRNIHSAFHLERRKRDAR